MGFALDFARFVVILACISSALWTDTTETTIAQTPGSEEPEYGIAAPLSLPCRRARGECVVWNKDFRQGFSTQHTPHRNDLNKDFQQGFSTKQAMCKRGKHMRGKHKQAYAPKSKEHHMHTLTGAGSCGRSSWGRARAAEITRWTRPCAGTATC
jgi:hypothetical protein